MRWIELVEEAGSERELRGRGTVNQYVLLGRSALGLGHCGRDVVDIGHEWPVADVDARLAAAQDPDWRAVVEVAAPTVRRLEGRPARDDRPGGHELVEHLAEDGLLAVEQPLVQAFPAVAQAITRPRIAVSEEPAREERRRRARNRSLHVNVARRIHRRPHGVPRTSSLGPMTASRRFLLDEAGRLVRNAPNSSTSAFARRG